MLLLVFAVATIVTLAAGAWPHRFVHAATALFIWRLASGQSAAGRARDSGAGASEALPGAE